MPHYNIMNILINTLIIFAFTILGLYAYSMALALNLI